MSQSPPEPEPSTAEIQARRAAERLGLAFLLYRDESGGQRIYALEDSSYRKVLVGRDPAADIALTWDQKVSGTHAELERVGDDWALIDDGLSRNGTFLNGDRVKGRRKLRDGDLIRFGETIALFRRPLIGSSDATVDTATNADLEARLLDPKLRDLEN
jgi:pSer/pThr/pTyr-binding forkhead associated (FHA) protein